MDQTIRFVTTVDGVKLAYARAGSGPPLLKTANWLNHLEYDWQQPGVEALVRAASRRTTRLCATTMRGSGLSDWRTTPTCRSTRRSPISSSSPMPRSSIASRCSGISQGAAVAIEYAVRHPERVTPSRAPRRLSRWAGRCRSPEAQRARHARSRSSCASAGARARRAFRRMFAELLMPQATEEQVSWFAELQRRTTKPEIAARIMEAPATSTCATAARR